MITGPARNPIDVADMLAAVDPDQLASELYDAPEAQQFVEDMTPFLTDMERESALWKKIGKHIADTVHNLRILNDEHRSEVETAAIRGKIAVSLEFLALGEIPAPDFDSDTPDLGY